MDGEERSTLPARRGPPPAVRAPRDGRLGAHGSTCSSSATATRICCSSAAIRCRSSASARQLVDRAVLTIGGSASITACGAARLGPHDRPRGVRRARSLRLARARAGGGAGRRRLGVPASANGDPTGITVVLARGDDRAILTSIGAIAALTVADVDLGLLRSARHLHIASYFLLDGLRPGLPELVAAAHAAGVTVSLDPQDDPAGRWESGLPELAPERVDVLFVNERESAARRPGRLPAGRGEAGPAGRARPHAGGSRRAPGGARCDGRRDRRRRQLRRRLPRGVARRASRPPTRSRWRARAGRSRPARRAGPTPSRRWTRRGRRSVILCVAANPSIDRLFTVERAGAGQHPPARGVRPGARAARG